MDQPEVVANYHCRLGENPLWNEREQRLYWVDIEAGRLLRLEHASGAHECFYSGELIGGFTFQEDGSLLLFEADRIAMLGADGRRRVLKQNIDSDMRRFNDVIADPEGRVFAGTIGRTDQSGGLYRVDLDGSVTVLWKGTGCANGMGFTPDLSHFYWTCSTTRQIYVCDYDRESGRLSDRRVFYQAPRAEGTPDGLSVDQSGVIWTARWDGSAVLRLSPSGQLLGKLEFPVGKVSSVAFGGPELDVLYATSAGGQLTDDGLEGALFRLRVAARGQPEFRSRIAL